MVRHAYFVFFILMIVLPAAHAADTNITIGKERTVINLFSEDYRSNATTQNASANTSQADSSGDSTTDSMTNSTKFKYISTFKDDYSKSNTSTTQSNASVNNTTASPQAAPQEKVGVGKVLRSN